MPGFEIAGIVLGAFPIALHLLDDYREMAKRAGLFYRIRLEYTKCRNDVDFQRVAFISHLRQLILPLLVDDSKSNRLLSEPGGDSWKDPTIEALLKDRLGDVYDLYVSYIKGMEDVMSHLQKELCMDSTAVQEQISTNRTSGATAALRNAANKAEFQLYKIKFSNGEAKRKELLGQLQDYNNKLEKLLSTSDRDAQLKKQRAAMQYKTSLDTGLCNFWRQASRLFQALAAAWNCTCGEDRHLTKLLLQHRTDKKAEFDVLFSAKEPSGWRIQHSRVCEEIAVTAVQSATQSSTTPAPNTNANAALPVRQPGHRTTAAVNLRSSLRTGRVTTTTSSGQRTVGSSSVTISAVQTRSATSASYTAPAPVSLTLDIPPILSLCSSVKQLQSTPPPTSREKLPCYGYLTAADDDNTSYGCIQSKKYYMHTLLHHETPSLTIVTLDQMITAGISRKQRYIIALTLASSFLQLLDTPWLPVSWKRSDIVFLIHCRQADPSQRLQPYIKRDISLLPLSHTPSPNILPPGSSSDSKTNIIDLNRSIDKLGIILLELCFGQLLESQYKKLPLTLPATPTAEQKTMFDHSVARIWLYEVEEEAGREFYQAVAWCLGSAFHNWRVDMLKHVVEPLVRCMGWLENGFK